MTVETTEKIKLTDRGIKALKPRAKEYNVADVVVPGLRVRVMPTGSVSFVVLGRFGGSPHPTRRSIGPYGRVTLEQARATTRDWFGLMEKGLDPAVEQERKRQAELRQQRTTFASVAEEYIAKKVAKMAKAHETELDIRRELLSRWGHKPITDVTRADIISMAEEIAERAPYQAHNVFARVRAIFNWAIARDVYGLTASPCDRLKPADLIGEKKARTRTLSDAEIRALWKVTERLEYPVGSLMRLLMLTGQRRDEACDARWREFDLDARLWSIPAERMKMDVPHVVPLSGMALDLLRGLPRFHRGDHLFSFSFGAAPINSHSKFKQQIDKGMIEELGKAPEPWTVHDIRRTVRTRLSALCPSDVAELVIAHSRGGIRAVYDHHSFEDEKRKALDAWASRLRDIIAPPPANVVPISKVV